jgi:adenylylsulfate kinase-like enzyme
MVKMMFDFEEACSQIMVEIDHILITRRPPILVALDGGSGAGKSTLASMLAQKVDSAVVQLLSLS